MHKPHESHWKEAKRILWYIQSTVQSGIHYSSRGTSLLVGFTNFDWAGNSDDRKSIANYVFSLGFEPITSACKKQWALVVSSTN
jgi:hypothetical protein